MFDKDIELLIYRYNKSIPFRNNFFKYNIYLKFKIRSFKIIIYLELFTEDIPFKLKPSDNYILDKIMNFNLFWYVVCPNKLDYFRESDNTCIYHSKFRFSDSNKFNNLIDYLKTKLIAGDNSINGKYFINTNDECDNYMLKALSKFL